VVGDANKRAATKKDSVAGVVNIVFEFRIGLGSGPFRFLSEEDFRIVA